MLAPFLFVVACSTTSSQEGASAPHGACRVEPVRWASESTDFDKRLSMDVADRLLTVAKADRDAFAGAHDPGQVGDRLNELNRAQAPNTAFVARPIANLALRLQQLECAMQNGAFSDPAMAVKRYEQIVSELEAEARALKPGA
jgi:hypothetical protein